MPPVSVSGDRRRSRDVASPPLYHAAMKIIKVRTRTFSLPHEDHAFAPTWQPAASTSHRLTVVEVHTDGPGHAQQLHKSGQAERLAEEIRSEQT